MVGDDGDQQPQMDTETSHTSTSASISLPQLRFDVPPRRVYQFSNQFRNASIPNNFLKGVKWSPDGSHFLTCSEDNTLRLFDLTGYDYSIYGSSCTPAPDEDSHNSSLILSEAESVYDFCWYPYMASSDPVSCVFASTTRDHPIHLWDSISGELRATYRAYDAMDEITAALSVAFNPSGSKLFAGYNKSLRVFDVHRPGREFAQYPTLPKNKEGLSGIVSAIAFCPTHTGMLAVGSYSRSTAIYTEDNMELLYVLHGQEGGVTHVLYSQDGTYLYTGGRKDPYILCWDIRNTLGAVFKLYRSSEHTNQRISFDIEPNGRHLCTGGQDGQVHIYDLQTGQWRSSFQAALDTVNGFSFNPHLGLAVSSSGHRRFIMPENDAENLILNGQENCASVWEFSYAIEDKATLEYGVSKFRVLEQPSGVLESSHGTTSEGPVA